MTRPLSLLTVALLSACASGDAAQESARTEAVVAPADATRVEIAVVRPSSAQLTLEIPGEVTGSRDALLASALGGLVEAVSVDEGDEVRAGQVLVRIDRDIYGAQVAQAQAQLSQAQGDLTRAEAMGDLATAASLSGLRTQVAVAEANVRVATTQLDRATIRAPFAGTIGAVDVEVGEVAPPGSPVVRLVALDPVHVSMSVPDRDVVALQVGLEAQVRTAASSGLRNGRIVQVAPVADLSTRAFLVDVEVPNPTGDLLPGMIATVEVERTLHDDAVVLPQDWIVTRLDGYGVFVDEGGKARWRDVELGDVVQSQVHVSAGLSPGDRVVMTGHQGLVDGDSLLIEREGWCCEAGRPVFSTTTADARREP